MVFSNDDSEDRQIRDRVAGQEGQRQWRQLEIARRIARETLKADHQALELDAKLAFRVTTSSWRVLEGDRV